MDDHLNLICLGGRIADPGLAWDLIQAFLAAEFSQAPRHRRRLRKVAALENGKRFCKVKVKVGTGLNQPQS